MRTLLLLALAATSLACSAHAPVGTQPQTGDLSFRLLWEGDADLDLHVFEPGGRHVGFMQPRVSEVGLSLDEVMELARNPSESGVLDIDCNASPHEICPAPIENVFWPVGAALPGEYRVWVQLFRASSDGQPVSYRLEVREGRRVRRVIREELAEAGRVSEHAIYQYRR